MQLYPWLSRQPRAGATTTVSWTVVASFQILPTRVSLPFHYGIKQLWINPATQNFHWGLSSMHNSNGTSKSCTKFEYERLYDCTLWLLTIVWDRNSVHYGAKWIYTVYVLNDYQIFIHHSFESLWSNQIQTYKYGYVRYFFSLKKPNTKTIEFQIEKKMWGV